MSTEHPYTRNFAEVYLAELDYVKDRRDEMDIPSDTVLTEIERVCELKEEVSESEIAHLNVASSKAGLVGLALSGGGVRSATFNLGLLQSLAKNKVLQYCDYLSTVSGGGYIGSCLSSLLADNKEYSTKKEAFPFRETDNKTLGERPEVNHLRATKNYLGVSRSLFNMENWHITESIVSGALLMSAIPLALFFLIFLILYFIPFFDESFLPNILWYEFALGLVMLLVLVFIGTILIRYIVTRMSSKVTHERYIPLKQGPPWATIVSMLIMASLIVGMTYWLAWTYVGMYPIFVYILLVSLLIILVGFLSTSKKKFQQTLIRTTTFIALTVFVCSLFSWLLSFGYAYERLKQFESLIDQIEDMEQKPIQSEYLKENLFLLKLKYHSDMSDLKTNKEWWINWFQAEILDEEIEKTREKANEAAKKAVNEALFLLTVKQLIQSDGLTKVMKKFEDNTFELHEIRQLIDEYDKKQIKTLFYAMKAVSKKTLSIKLAFAIPIGIAIIILLVIGMLLNINRNSLHYFYRDRLSKTYMIKWAQKRIEPNPSVLLTDIHQCCNGPYHLINTTLNVPDSKNPLISGRGTDFFIFSKCYCGAESTGYRCTDFYNQGQTRLATAMALSGAAISPERGANPFMTVLMTWLNFRLNLWMPNPNRKRPPEIFFWLPYRYKELFRKGTENDALLNLSDGGHHENLGIYPLLKRRCRVIIASDAGADPKFQMDDLANLQRKARIDLGINIDINLKDLRPDPNNNNYTQVHFVKGTIQYPDDEPGTLFYIKSTLTGDEPEDLLAYKRIYASFPDETTADQFFDENQFESYRKLGELSGEAVFSEILKAV